MVVAGRRVKLVALAVGAATVLAGCGLHPGAAAVVGSETISHERVDDLASAICSAQLAVNQAQGAQTERIPTRSLREASLGALVQTELSQQFGEERGVEPNRQQVSEIVSRSEQNLGMLPEDEREVYRDVVRENAEGQTMMLAVGREELGDVSEQEALNEGFRLLQDYAQEVGVEVDPRYGRFEQGNIVPGGTALSVPVSERAQAGADQQLAPGFVATLPASQLCS
ncbi:MAG TPA: hypothetical protein VFZ64_09570 [Nocardioidaceae bacterium]